MKYPKPPTKFFVLRGRRVILRPLGMSDVHALLKTINDEKNSRYLGVEAPLTLKEEKEYIRRSRRNWRKGEDYAFVIEEKTTHKIIGGVALHTVKKVLSQWRPSIGIRINKEFWRKGYAAEACTLVLEFAFDRLKLPRVEYHAFHPNTPSIKLAKKLGFRVEGKLRRAIEKKGKVYDSIVLGMLAQEWLRRKH